MALIRPALEPLLCAPSQLVRPLSLPRVFSSSNDYYGWTAQTPSRRPRSKLPSLFWTWHTDPLAASIRAPPPPLPSSLIRTRWVRVTRTACEGAQISFSGYFFLLLLLFTASFGQGEGAREPERARGERERERRNERGSERGAEIDPLHS